MIGFAFQPGDYPQPLQLILEDKQRRVLLGELELGWGSDDPFTQAVAAALPSSDGAYRILAPGDALADLERVCAEAEGFAHVATAIALHREAAFTQLQGALDA